MPYTEIYIPFSSKISDGNRNATLSAICIKAICLNPTASFKRILATMKSINQKICLNPKSEKALEHIVKTDKNKDNFKLQSNKDKRFFFEDPSQSLSEKKSIVMTYINKRKSRLRRKEVCDCINEMEESGDNFRVADIARECGSSPNTIKDMLRQMPSEHLPQNLINRQKFL